MPLFGRMQSKDSIFPVLYFLQKELTPPHHLTLQRRSRGRFRHVDPGSGGAGPGISTQQSSTPFTGNIGPSAICRPHNPPAQLFDTHVRLSQPSTFRYSKPNMRRATGSHNSAHIPEARCLTRHGGTDVGFVQNFGLPLMGRVDDLPS